MANEKALPVTDPMAQITALLTTLGGTKQTSNPGDTSALQTAFAGTQAFDPAALLQSIFQQAGGAIPGLQNAYGNAVGARRGGNSAIQNALNALMSQTAIEGQKQVVAQQQQNLQTQANIGGNIAQATKGTKQTTGTDLGAAAKNMLILQGLAKLAGTDTGKQIVGGGGLFGQLFGSNPASAAPANQAQMSMAPAGTFAPVGAPLDIASLLQGGGADIPAITFDPESQQVTDLLTGFADQGDAMLAPDNSGYSEALPDMSGFDLPVEAIDPMDYFYTN